MEVGLGGRLDASNTWAADVAAITGVGLDHQEYLGDDVESIAAEKAAIIKPGCRAVTGASGAALAVIEARAREVGVPLTVCPPLAVTRMDLSGLTRAGAAAGEACTCRSWAATRRPMPRWRWASRRRWPRQAWPRSRTQAVVAGLARARWPGRLELLERDGLTILLDGAHNPDGAAALAAAIDELAPHLPGGPADAAAGGHGRQGRG